MIKETVGDRIAKIRESIKMPNGKKMSQEDLEKLSGVARRTIQNIEANKVEPQLSNVIAIVEAIRADVGEVVSGKKQKPVAAGGTPKSDLFLTLVTRLTTLDEEQLRDILMLVPDSNAATGLKSGDQGKK